MLKTEYRVWKLPYGNFIPQYKPWYRLVWKDIGFEWRTYAEAKRALDIYLGGSEAFGGEDKTSPQIDSLLMVGGGGGGLTFIATGEYQDAPMKSCLKSTIKKGKFMKKITEEELQKAINQYSVKHKRSVYNPEAFIKLFNIIRKNRRLKERE